MVLDSFRNLTDQETKKKIDDWFFDLEYLDKIRILLRAYPGYSITKLEARNIHKLWNALSLERQKEIYQGAWKYIK